MASNGSMFCHLTRRFWVELSCHRRSTTMLAYYYRRSPKEVNKVKYEKNDLTNFRSILRCFIVILVLKPVYCLHASSSGKEAFSRRTVV